jgi:hypothetical protein
VAEIRESERQLDLYSTPYFLKLLCDQLAYDPRVASERAALFTASSGARWSARSLGKIRCFVRDGVLHPRSRAHRPRDWINAYDLPRRGPLMPSLQALAYAMQERCGGEATASR